MSYALHAYAVEVKNIQKIFGSRDEAFLNNLVAQRKPQLLQLRDIADTEMSPLDALKELIAGKVQETPEAARMYAHICELICAFVGETLPNSEWSDLSMNWLMDVNMEAQMPMDLPLPTDFPYILTILNKDLEDFVDIMGALDLEEESAWEQFEAWVSLLKKGKKDLVLFFY